MALLFLIATIWCIANGSGGWALFFAVLLILSA